MKTNKVKESKKLILLILLLVTLVTSIGAGAYWALGTINTPPPVTGDTLVTVGEGKAVDTIITLEPTGLGPDKPLVPLGYEDANSVSDLDIVFNQVLWYGTGAKGAKGDLTVSVVSFKVGVAEYTYSDGLYGGLFTITLPAVKEITAGTPEVVNINLEFTHEPQSKDVYDLIANNTITIVFRFEVTPN